MTADPVRDVILEGLSPESAALFRSCEGELAADLKVLPDKPQETVLSTLAALWHTAAGEPLSVQCALLSALPALDDQGIVRLRALLRHRLEGTPLAYLTGRQHFMGLELLAYAGALIPRVETELLGWAALERLQAMVLEKGDVSVIDLCTGSGNLALALAWHEPRARVWGADLSEEAVAIARGNAAHLGLADRVAFQAGDLLAPFETPEFLGRVDLLVCNPPYISSGRVDGMAVEIGHEPRLAFDGGPMGVRILLRLLNEAPRYLRPGGWLAFEVGLGQGRGTRQRLEQQKAYVNFAEVLDSNGQVRALLARYEPAAK